MNDNLPEAPQGEFILFRSGDGQTHVECRFESDTLWLSQAEIANLYQITPQAITRHIKAIYGEGELVQNSTCKSFLQVRQWATQTPEQYLLKEFVMDNGRRVYLRVKEIFTLAADYKSSNKETTRFFQTIQNKLHFA